MPRNNIELLAKALWNGEKIYAENLTSGEYTRYPCSSSKYEFRCSTREVFANLHFMISVKEIGSIRFITINGWVLQEIFFQNSWNYLCSPVIKVVDPDGNRFSVSVPNRLKPYIDDIPLSMATNEDRINRITEALEIFQEVANYANKDEFEKTQE